MRVLWITNIIFPEAVDGKSASFGGGWMISLMAVIKDKIQLGIVSKYSSSYSKDVDGVTYYLLKNWTREIPNVISSFKPDIIHIHGSEYPHSLIVNEHANNIPCVCSIQGLISVYSRFSLGSISTYEILRNTTIKDVLRKSSPFLIQRGQKKRGISEIKLFEKLKYVIGRTQWDLEHVKSINPNIKYYYCNECLRDCFYDGLWSIENVKRNTLFCCNSSVPLKGIHQIVKALQIVKGQIPDIQLRIAGKNILGKLSIKGRLKLSGYDKYLRNLIYSLGLEKNILFLGGLSAIEVKRELLHCNTFVLASSIENSPNSLAEAQILGVPIISSNVGGVSSMLGKDFIEYSYRFEEYEMLAQAIIRNLKKTNWIEYSKKMQEMAKLRHNRDKIKIDLINIYNTIIKNESGS